MDSLLSFKTHGVEHYNAASKMVSNLMELAKVHEDSEAARDILSEPINKVPLIASY